MEPQCYVLRRTWLSVAVSLVLWRFSVWVAVAVLDHRVVIQPLTNHLLLLGTCKGKDPSIMHRSAQLIPHMNPPLQKHGARAAVSSAVFKRRWYHFQSVVNPDM